MNPLIDQAIVAVGCGAAVFAFFGKRGLWVAILTCVFAWKYPEIAVGVAGGACGLFLILQMPKRKSEVKSEVKESEIIDAEFTVVGDK